MSDERTRTTKEVRDGYAYDSYSGDVDPYYELRFDRWLAAHDTEIRAAALEEAAGIADHYDKGYGQHPNDGIVKATQTAIARVIRSARVGD